MSLVLLLVLGSGILFIFLFQGEDSLSEIRIEGVAGPVFRPTDPAKNLTDPETRHQLVAGEIVVVGVEGISPDEISRIVAKIGGRIVGGMEHLGIFQVEIPGDDIASIYSALEALENVPEIVGAFPNYVPVSQIQRVTPDDPQWTEKRNQEQRWGQEYIGLPEAWTVTTGAADLRLGVIDVGFDPRHPDLTHLVVRVGNPEWYRKVLEEVGWQTHLSHGNAVASIVGARADNREGMAGVVWYSKLYGYVSNSTTDFLELLRAAAQDGVRVVNVSLGWIGQRESLADVQKRSGELDALRVALDRFVRTEVPGLLIIVSAGNNPNVSTDYEPLASLAADLENVLTVGAIGPDSNRASFSSWGESVSVAAPGVDIWAATATNWPHRNWFWVRWVFGLYKYHDGTSFAAPFVTGVVGLIWSVNPYLTPGQVKQIIVESANPHSFDRPLGSGVVNAAKALEAVGQPQTVPVPSGLDPNLWEFARQVESALADKDVEFFIAKTITQDFKAEDFTKPLNLSPELDRLMTSYPSQLPHLRRRVPPELENDPKKKLPGVKQVIPQGFLFAISIEQYRKQLQKMFAEAKSEETDELGTGKVQLYGITKASTLIATYITIDDLVGKYREILQFFLEKRQGRWYISSYGKTYGVGQFTKTNIEKLKEWDTLVKWPNFR
ncbi:MAG: Thermophilic serine proteinase [Syntrophomonadaceae bacterium]|nr:Thermophilic serine proteinase [Bacillota bacterium]